MKQLLAVALLSSLLFSCADSVTTDIKVENLRCEYMREAIVSKASPRFSWELSSDIQDQNQSAWQIIVSDDKNKLEQDKGDIWNSGKRKGGETFGIKWKKVSLTSFTKYYWKVRAWDKEGKVSEWSHPANFITGALDPSHLIGSWIGDEPEPPLDYPLLYKHMGYLSAYAESADERKWVQIDLGKSRSFDQIKLYPTHQNNREMIDYYFPLAYQIEASSNGNDWSILIMNSNADDPDNKPVILPLKETEARYIRFTATNMRRYEHINFNPNDPHNRTKEFAFSLAELEVLNNNSIISQGAKVTYQDALIKIDRENGYDPDMLCDGITNTPPHPIRRAIPPSPLLRKTFLLKEKPVKAIACVSALGMYEIGFNAQSPDHRVLAPEWTDYNKRVQYQLFDVTKLLKSGTNVIGAQLADGWYAGMLGPVRWSPYFPKRGAYGLDRRLFFQMTVVYPDGEEETIVSDGSWKIFEDGPLQLADNFIGETYNANKEIPNWQKAEYDDSNWERVVGDQGQNKNLVPQINQPIKVVETLNAQAVTQTKDGHFIFDVGENIAGWCQIDLKGKPGDLIVMQHGEMLDEEGELYTENLGMAVQIDSVILGPSGQLTYEPRFTYHGFRFVEVTGLRFVPDKSILSAKVVASDQPRTGYFSCSNPMLNQLYKNINRSHVSNMHSVPTDCPQRDERCGWMGDAYIFAQASIFNRDMAAFYNKWIVDIIDAQSERGTFPDIAPHPFAYEKHFTGVPGWADAGIQVPFILYQNYGDTEIIEDHFESYEKYIQNIHENNPDHTWTNELGNNYGDWLNGNTLRAEGFPRTGAQIPSDVFATIMYFNSTSNLSEMAKVIGENKKASYYSELADSIKTSFVRNFVDSVGIIKGDAQSCYALALHYEIYPENLEEEIEQRMIDKFIPYDGRMNTGFHSTLPLMKELVKRGYSDKAFQLLETTEFPSWGYSIEQGATSIWERWDGYVKGRGLQGAGMNSFNHYAFGAVGEWMYMNILGIQLEKDNPGFTHFTLKPLPGGSLTWAEGSYHSICGNIKAKWKKENGVFEYSITIPTNTSATVHMPGKLKIDRFDPGDFKYENNHSTLELGSGKYVLVSEIECNEVDDRVHAFYYAWYENTEIDGTISHWNHSILPHGPDPRWLDAGAYPGVDDIGANFYPALGAYSSHDPVIIDQHMKMMKEAGIGVVAISWWGENGKEAKSIIKYLDSAHKYGLKLAFHIEPIFKTVEEFKKILDYIISNFGDHPGLYLYNDKPFYYIYDSYKVNSDEWKRILDPASPETIRNTPLDATFIGIWVLRSTREFFLNSGFDGFYTYYASDKYVWASNPENWSDMAQFAADNQLIFCPSVGPGYIDTRIRPWNNRTTIDREGGKYYTSMFRQAITHQPDFISITSFNEWHEGTQIEPSISKTIEEYTYEDFGKDTDPNFYLKLTKKLIEEYEK